MTDRTKVCSSVWLPAEIVVCIVGCLSANDIACTGRLINKAASQKFSNCKTVRLSLPSPPHAFKHHWGRPERFRAYTQKQRIKLLCLTAASGSIANLEVALDNAGLCVQGRWELLGAAAAAGQLAVCKMLHARGCVWGISLNRAAGGGHRQVCEWMLDSGCSLTFSAVEAAARGGHEDLVIWLLALFREGNTRGVVDVGRVLEAAAAGLGLAAFQRLYQQLAEAISQEEQRGRILAAAAGSSTPDWQAKVEWLEGQNYPRTHKACESAAAYSPDEEAVSRLKWLLRRGYTPDGNAVGEAAEHGNLDALDYLWDQLEVGQNILWSDWDIAEAGHLAVLQYLHGNDLTLGFIDVPQAAAMFGHLSMLAWAVAALGVTPDNSDYLLSSAAYGGSVELMAWLRERGWDWGYGETGEIVNAVESGCLEAVEWLVEQGCPWEVDGDAYIKAAETGDLAMIYCLHRLGCPWGPPGNVLVECIRDRSIPIPRLQCLVGLGCPVDWDAAVRKAEEHSPGEHRTNLLAWLGEERMRWRLQLAAAREELAAAADRAAALLAVEARNAETEALRLQLAAAREELATERAAAAAAREELATERAAAAAAREALLAVMPAIEQLAERVAAVEKARIIDSDDEPPAKKGKPAPANAVAAPAMKPAVPAKKVPESDDDDSEDDESSEEEAPPR